MKTSNEQLHAKLTYFGNTFNTDTVLNTPNNGQHIAGILQYLELVQNMPGGGVGKLGIVVQIF